MSMFNRRNAVIGYLALRALKQARRNAALGYLTAQGVERTRAHRRGRRLFRFASYLALAIVSAGVLAAVAALYWRRRSSTEAALDDGVEVALETIEEAGAEAGETVAESAPAA
jgi:hypothetical protein